MKLNLKTITAFVKKNSLVLLLGIFLIVCMFSSTTLLVTETFKHGKDSMKKHTKHEGKEKEKKKKHNKKKEMMR